MYLYLSKNYNLLSQKLFKSSAYVFSITAFTPSLVFLPFTQCPWNHGSKYNGYFLLLWEDNFFSVEVRKRPQDILQFPAFLVKRGLKRSILHHCAPERKWCWEMTNFWGAFSNDLYRRKEKKKMKKTSWELKCARKCIKEGKEKRKPSI